MRTTWCLRYNQTFEDDVETRAALLRQIVGAMGEDGFIQGPVQFHYGTHTTIGKRFFGNFNLTIQDDARVTIGDDVNCGPNVTIVTPVHPLLTVPPKSAVMMFEPGTKPFSPERVSSSVAVAVPPLIMALAVPS